jgi:hypothetical protein
MIIVWVSIVQISALLWHSNIILHYGAVILGFPVGLVVVWIIEYKIFPTRQRWATLEKALTIVRNKIVRVKAKP